MNTTERNMSTEENSRTPQLRFPGFTGEWVEKNLGEIGDIYSGLSGKSKEDFEKGGARFITFLNVMKNIRIDTNMLGVVNVREGEKQNSVKYGDLLFNTSSETPEEVGICSVYDSKSDEKVYLNSFCFGYRLKNHLEYSPLYIAYFFRSIYGRELMRRIAQGITRFNLSKEYFNKAEVPFPSLAEQQKIAECLSEMDSIIAAQGEQLDILKEKKKGLMQQLFPRNGETTPRLRFPGFTGEWKERKLGESFDERIERNREDLPLLSLGENGLAYQRDTARKDNSNKDKSKYLRVVPGDIAYNTMRMWQGRCVCVNIEGIVSPAYTVCKPKKGIDSLFHYYLFKTYRMIQIFHQHSQGLVSDTLNLKYEAFSNISYMLPPSLTEQQEIAECLSALDDRISTETARLEALKGHKKGLMQKLFPEPSK